LIDSINIILGLCAFGIFSLLQGIVIIGIKGSMDEGQILHGYFKRVSKLNFFSKPLGTCIKCMASVYGSLLYWPCVLLAFGFDWWQLPVWVADIFALVYINFYLYKKG